MMLLYTLLIFSLGASAQKEDFFISPIYELGSNVPTIQKGEDVKPGKPATLAPEIINRLGEKDQTPAPPVFVLGSNPPVSHIHLVQPGPIVPPGEPWPADDDKTTKRPITTTTTTTARTTKRATQSPFSWPTVVASGSTTNRPTTQQPIDVINRFDGDQPVKPSIVLDYKPMRPSFHPSPGNNIGTIIPPGEPWPANPEGYENFGSRPQSTTRRPIPTRRPQNPDDVFNRFDEKTTSKPSDYRPMRPSYDPKPGNNVPQIKPPGKPWPTRDENRPSRPFNPEDIFNRFDEDKPQYPQHPQYAGQYQDFYPSDAYPMAEIYQNPQIVYILHGGDYEDPYPKPALVLDYKPQRPFYHPNPGNLVAQIIPPGEPWPAR